MATNLRVGIGHDTHRLEPGGPLLLGGVTVPHDRRLAGHSDADVLLHAVTDALLGAVAAGDIGSWFPNTAEENAGRDSSDMIARVVAHVAEQGYRVVNLDCVVHAQQPKLAEYRDAMREHIAGLLNVPVDAVSVKAKTGEHAGPVGRLEVIQAEAIVLVEKTES